MKLMYIIICAKWEIQRELEIAIENGFHLSQQELEELENQLQAVKKDVAELSKTLGFK